MSVSNTLILSVASYCYDYFKSFSTDVISSVPLSVELSKLLRFSSMDNIWQPFSDAMIICHSSGSSSDIHVSSWFNDWICSKSVLNQHSSTHFSFIIINETCSCKKYFAFCNWLMRIAELVVNQFWWFDWLPAPGYMKINFDLLMSLNCIITVTCFSSFISHSCFSGTLDPWTGSYRTRRTRCQFDWTFFQKFHF